MAKSLKKTVIKKKAIEKKTVDRKKNQKNTSLAWIKRRPLGEEERGPTVDLDSYSPAEADEVLKNINTHLADRLKPYLTSVWNSAVSVLSEVMLEREQDGSSEGRDWKNEQHDLANQILRNVDAFESWARNQPWSRQQEHELVRLISIVVDIEALDWDRRVRQEVNISDRYRLQQAANGKLGAAAKHAPKQIVRQIIFRLAQKRGESKSYRPTNELWGELSAELENENLHPRESRESGKKLYRYEGSDGAPLEIKYDAFAKALTRDRAKA